MHITVYFHDKIKLYTIHKKFLNNGTEVQLLKSMHANLDVFIL